MRIALLSDPTNFHCQKWAVALQRAGAEITVIGFTTAELPNVEVIAFPTTAQRLRYYDFWYCRKALKKTLLKKGIQLLHPLHLTPYGSWGYWSGFRPMVPAAMGADVFEYIPEYQPLITRHWDSNTLQAPTWWQRQMLSWRRWWFRKQVRQLLAAVDWLTADNMPLCKALSTYFRVLPSQVRLLRWGIDPELFDTITESDSVAVYRQLGISVMRPLIFSPRGARPLYQADIILKAFEYILQNQLITDHHFLLLGAGYTAGTEIVNQARTLQTRYPNQFTFYGDQLTARQMAALWRCTTIFVSAPVYDGYSAALAEGRYAGAIPIVNAIPGNEEVITDRYNGLIVSPFSAEKLAEAVLFAYQQRASIQPIFAERNRNWIIGNSLLAVAANQFINWAGETIENTQRKYI
jgi:glycosyltransferase involved in cell wall biosynthesis